MVFWDNGTVGNYWSDYLTRYPNASEIDSTGIGNTPYVIDKNNIDHYPLLRAIPIPLASPSASIAPTPTATIPEFPSWIILPLLVVSLVVSQCILRKITAPQSPSNFNRKSHS